MTTSGARLPIVAMPSRMKLPPAYGSFRCGSASSSCSSTALLRTLCSPGRKAEPPVKCAIGWCAAPAPAAP
eukprot:8750137-Alexandrium_andersonii.AAC.1